MHNRWNLVMGTYDGANMTIYVNGVQQGTQCAFTGNITSNSDGFAIGARGVGGSSYFTGPIDDVRIYNRALSAGEVADLYTMGTATVNASTNALNTNGLVGEWSFDGKQTV